MNYKQSKQRDWPELRFQFSLQRDLNDAGIRQCTSAFLVDTPFDKTRIYARPDICIEGSDGKALIAIEVKPNCALHCITQAIGQCLVYQEFVPRTFICVPDTLWLASKVEALCERLQIPVVQSCHLVGYVQDIMANGAGLKAA